MGGAISN